VRELATKQAFARLANAFAWEGKRSSLHKGTGLGGSLFSIWRIYTVEEYSATRKNKILQEEEWRW
jgi:hypothetical protein